MKNKPINLRHLVGVTHDELGLRPRWINHISPCCLKITLTSQFKLYVAYFTKEKSLTVVRKYVQCLYTVKQINTIIFTLSDPPKMKQKITWRRQTSPLWLTATSVSLISLVFIVFITFLINLWGCQWRPQSVRIQIKAVDLHVVQCCLLCSS